MKPVHIGLMVAAGTLGGAMFVKMMQGPAPAPAPPLAPTMAQQTAPEPAAAPAPEPAKAAEPLPSPFPEKAAKPVERKATRPSSKPAETRVARNEPPVQAAPPAPAPAPEPVREAAPPPVAPTPAVTAPEPPPPPPPPPQRVTLQAGTLIPVRLVEGLSTERNKVGDTFTATLDQPLVVDGFVIAERGARLEGRVAQAEQAGRVRGTATLAIELTRLTTSDGQKVAIATDTFTKAGPTSVKEDVAKGAAATGIGAAIGAIAGGGKGAAIGAAVGAATGTGAAMATRGKPATLPTETRLNLRLREPVTITERRR